MNHIECSLHITQPAGSQYYIISGLKWWEKPMEGMGLKMIFKDSRGWRGRERERVETISQNPRTWSTFEYWDSPFPNIALADMTGLNFPLKVVLSLKELYL